MRRKPAAGRAPSGLEVVASVESPPMSRLVRLTLKDSDNFFAEMLAKDLASRPAGGAPPGSERGSPPPSRGDSGPGAPRGRLRALAREPGVSLPGGPLLAAMLKRDEAKPCQLAPDRGTRRHAWTGCASGPARLHCHAKTGTLSDVSALSGVCDARSGDTYAFSILMNGIYPGTARGIQDRMAQAIAAIRN